jgi:hypothetical protein
MPKQLWDFPQVMWFDIPGYVTALLVGMTKQWRLSHDADGKYYLTNIVSDETTLRFHQEVFPHVKMSHYSLVLDKEDLNLLFLIAEL